MFGFSNADEKLERIAIAFERQAAAVERYMEAAIASHRASELAAMESRRCSELAAKTRECELKIRQIELDQWRKEAAKSSS